MIAETVPKLVKHYKTVDPNTAINASMLCTLVGDGRIRSARHGNRIVLNRNVVAEDISLLLNVNCDGMPHLRSIRSAVGEMELRSNGVGEERLRDWVKSGDIPSLHIGSWDYIALESLTNDALEKLEHFTFSQPKTSHVDKEYEKVKKRLSPSSFRRIRK